MKRRLGRWLLPLGMASLSGCLTHVPAHEDSGSLRILWREDFENAQRQAGESGRPLLVVMAAGDLRDKC